MIMQVYKSRGKEYVRIIESYRDPVTKQPKTKVIETFGNKEALLASDPEALEKIRRKVEIMNANAEQLKQEEISKNLREFLEIKASAEMPEHFPVKNYGCWVYQKLWNELNLDYFFDYRQKRYSKIKYPVKNIVSMLVTSRLLDPDSKKATYEKWENYLTSRPCKLEEVYRTLSFLGSQKESLEKHLNKQLAESYQRNLSVAFYDVTTYYFESVEADSLKKFGYSKDNKVNQVQVVMGLLIDDQGIPISYELFPGNTSDFRTLEPVMKSLKERYGISRLIITADRGLNSKGNLAFLRSIGFDYVMAYKIRSASNSVKSDILDETSYTSLNSSFKFKEMPLKQSLKYNGEYVGFTDRLIMTWSMSRQLKDRKDRERLIQKAKKLVESKSNMKTEMQKGGKKYVQMTFFETDRLEFNDKKAAYDEQFDGYYGIVTSDESLSTFDIVSLYEGLWKIEESFRVMKTNLEARPIYVWTEASIRGHFVVCYLALVMQRFLEYRMRLNGYSESTECIQESLRNATLTQITPKDKLAMYLKNTSDGCLAHIFEVMEMKDIPSCGFLKDVKW